MNCGTPSIGSTSSPRATVAVLALASTLASCAPSTPSVEVETRAVLVRAPDALTLSCARPVPLPPTGLDAGTVARFWGRDRVALATCVDRHAALTEHVRAQEKAQDVTAELP